ncbi:ACT domain-containing protein [candidate division KSB1 bacterium]|nr:ACT domain-containing protein [candidate division KSB1 bacterium]
MSFYQFMHSGNYVKIIVHDIPEKPGVIAKISKILATHHINIFTIKHSVHTAESGDIAFTVSKDRAEESINLMKSNLDYIGGKRITFRKDLALVFIWGEEIRNLSRFASDILRALSEYDVEIDSLSIAIEGITCILPEKQYKEAMHAFNKMFIDEPFISPV